MDYAKYAISRVLQDQNLSPLLDRGVKPEMFPDPESKAVLKFILDFYQQHRSVPSPTLVENQFQGYTLKYAPDPAEYYVTEVLKMHARTNLTDTLLQNAKKLLTDDPFVVGKDLRTAFNQTLSLGNTHRELLFSDKTDERWQQYLDRKNKVGLLGIPTPWQSLDDLTQGWQPEMYFGFVARPGVGKTWNMLRIGHKAHEEGYKVLFVNKELPTDMMSRRLDAMRFQLAYERLRTGMLTTAEEQRYEQGLKNLAATPGPDWVWLHGASTVSSIAAKVEEHEPDLVIVDGAYLLVDEQNGRQAWERYTNISRGLKRLTQDYKLPLGISIQLSRTGDTRKSKTPLTLSDVMGTDAWAQDVDILVALDQDEAMAATGEMKYVPLKSREAPPTPWLVRNDFDSMESKDLGQTTRVVAAAGDDPLDFD